MDLKERKAKEEIRNSVTLGITNTIGKLAHPYAVAEAVEAIMDKEMVSLITKVTNKIYQTLRGGM